MIDIELIQDMYYASPELWYMLIAILTTAFLIILFQNYKIISLRRDKDSLIFKKNIVIAFSMFFAGSIASCIIALSSISSEYNKTNLLEEVSAEAKRYEKKYLDLKETLKSINFSGVNDSDFTKDSKAYMNKFWYGEDLELQQKYFNGNLSDDELYALCSEVTDCMASMRVCKYIYYSHHGSNNPKTILNADQLTPQQLEEIAMELCGKSTCKDEEEIKKHTGGHNSSYFCGSSGCFVGEYSILYSDTYDQILEKIK